MKIKQSLPIIVIQGPTAVGKSSLAIQLAQKLNTEIISADSRQVYRYMDIGTAKPTLEEQRGVQHHLIDVVTPDMRYSAGLFAAGAAEIIQALLTKDRIPIIVGGTGFYIKALLDGLFQAPPIAEEIRQKVMLDYETEGFDKLYQYLTKIDSESAKRIAKNDKNRLMRALEVYEATGKSISQHWKEQRISSPYQVYNILLVEERKKLYKQINERVLKMLENGLIMEFQMLLNKGYTKHSPGLNTVGYKEFFPFIEEQESLQKCVEKIQKHTRNYAKRQFTWYRREDFNLTFHTTDINFSTIHEVIKKWLKNFQWEF